jgi:hypothetical protein
MKVYNSLTLKQAPTMGSEITFRSKGGAGRRDCQRTTTSAWKGIKLLLTFLTVTQAQDTPQIGVDICACAPSSYEFILDFSLFCPPVNITLGDAVAKTSCAVNPYGTPEVADLVPVAVSSIDVYELNQDMKISVRQNIAGSYGDGETFQYTSIAALPDEMVNPEDLPRAIQLNIIGVNQFDEPLINIYLIVFTNNCGRYPVLFEGQSAGWTRFVSEEEQNFCEVHEYRPLLTDFCFRLIFNPRLQNCVLVRRILPLLALHPTLHPTIHPTLRHRHRHLQHC